jgi:hypothetical protein
MAKISKYLLNLAGEYRICSELNKRGVFATVTYGNRKSVDVYAISNRKERALKVEVKTIQQGNFVTNITRKGLDKDPHAPDFWVLFQIRPDQNAGFKERFFVLTHREICRAQKARNQAFAREPSHAAGSSSTSPRGSTASGLRTWSSTRASGRKSSIGSVARRQGTRCSGPGPHRTPFVM